MVMKRTMKQSLALAALTVVSAPLAADGILEQMQNEVAAIAGRTRTAVVTVEDERAVITANDFRFFLGDADDDAVTLSGARRLAEERVKHLDTDRVALEKRIALLKTRFDV